MDNNQLISYKTYDNLNIDNIYYDNVPKIYLYNQYKDIDYLNSFIKILNDIIYNELHNNIKYWYALKSNCTTDIQKYTESEYFLFFISNLLNLKNMFGYPVSIIKWDNNIKYDSEWKWDTVESKGIIDVYKIKAFIRFIYDLSYNGWSLYRFIKFCYEVCYETNNIKIWVDDTSFSFDSITIYYNKTTTAINELTDLCVLYKDMLPLCNIKFQFLNK